MMLKVKGGQYFKTRGSKNEERIYYCSNFDYLSVWLYYSSCLYNKSVSDEWMSRILISLIRVYMVHANAGTQRCMDSDRAMVYTCKFIRAACNAVQRNCTKEGWRASSSAGSAWKGTDGTDRPTSTALSHRLTHGERTCEREGERERDKITKRPYLNKYCTHIVRLSNK